MADVVAPRSEDRKLIIRIINFEVIQLICSAYINVTDRRTERQTDGQLTIAIPRFALRASHDKNTVLPRTVVFMVIILRFVVL